MRLGRLIVVCAVLGQVSCHTYHRPNFKTIAIQPIRPFDGTEIPLLAHALQAYFQHPVIVLPPITLPRSYTDYRKGERYSADSIINHLTGSANDTITQVVGFTHEDIFTTKRDPSGHVLYPAETNNVWGIFGLGYRSGKASVVSDYRLHCSDVDKYYFRLRTVLFHEIGHNLGLAHCPNPGCIMNDVDGSISTIDSSGLDYCSDCRRRLYLYH